MTLSSPPQAPEPGETVAIWLQLDPYQALVGEGIGQHLSHMLADWSSARAEKAVLLAPVWARQTVEEMFRTYDLPRDQISAKFFGPPLISQIFRDRTKTRIQQVESPDYSVAARLEKVPLPGLLALLLLPFSPFLLVLLLLVRLVGGRGKGVARRLVATFMLILRAATFASMAAYVNRSKRISFCIVPIGNWTMCRLIRKTPLVVQIPDIVFLEFPAFFDKDAGINTLAQEIQKVARRADAVISPSEHVRQNHIIKFLGVPEEKAFYAPHAAMLLDKALKKLMPQATPPSRAEARAELSRQWDWIMQRPHYLERLGGSLNWYSKIKALPLEDVRLVYFPTQYRPYKNIERTIEAMAALKKQPGKPIVLLLTADLSVSPGAIELIEKLDLLDHVIPLPRLTQPYHALMNAAADLVLAASRFEGGFPFLPGEALSLGTPVVMADIPIVRATIPPNLRARMTFRAEDTPGMAAAVFRALNDNGLYLEQTRWFYEMRRNRRWADVLNDYLDAGRTAVAARRAASLSGGT